VKQKFDPEKFAGVFTRGGGGPPRWLDGLLQDWRGPALPTPECWKRRAMPRSKGDVLRPTVT